MGWSRVVGLAAALVVSSLLLTACGSSNDITPASSTVAGGTTVDVVLGGGAKPLSIATARAGARSGDVSFSVRNVGKIDHELVVLKTDVPFDRLPVADAGDPPAPVTTGADKVDEAANVGETGDPNLKPGESRTFTIKGMRPGRYVLVCNLPGHYAGGMRAPFTVT